jgi:hypothetical protein
MDIVFGEGIYRFLSHIYRPKFHLVCRLTWFKISLVLYGRLRTRRRLAHWHHWQNVGPRNKVIARASDRYYRSPLARNACTGLVQCSTTSQLNRQGWFLRFVRSAHCLEVQKKAWAQTEIDAVVGPLANRLPDFHDCPSMPDINAVVYCTTPVAKHFMPKQSQSNYSLRSFNW